MNLLPLLESNSIAVVGASHDHKKIGAQIFANLTKSNFKGTLIPINPKGGVIQGHKSLKNISEYSQSIDLVIIAIPQEFVESVIDECINKKVKSIIIITAGFREMGPQGKEIEDRIQQKLLKARIPMLGPNCLGLINPSHNINASFATYMPQKGPVMFISQSGAFGTAGIDWATNQHLGFSHFVSLGNKAILNENDFIQRVTDNTKVISLYLEEITDGKTFMSLAQSITPKTPILLLKPGKSEKAALAVKSHTGSLTGTDHILTVATKQSGILRVDTTEQLFNLTKAFACLPELKGNRIAVITNAGGPGIITTDALETSGLELAPISLKTQHELSKHLPREANIHDPIDLIGDAKAERYNHALKAVMKEDTVDACIVILTPQSATEIDLTAQSIMAHANQTKKPILAAFLGGSLVEQATKTLTKNNIPCYNYPEQAVYVLSRMWEYQQSKARLSNLPPIQNITHLGESIPQSIIRKAKKEDRTILLQEEVEQFFKSTNITFPVRMEVTSSNDAYTKAQKIGLPIVMKISSEKIIHKTEKKAVYLNLQEESQIKESYSQLAALLKRYPSQGSSIYIQQQIPIGTEVLIGMKRDPVFGPVIVVGTGGTYTELYQDTSSRIAPLTKSQAQQMLEETKIYQILKGYRGKEGIDITPIIHAILNVSNISLSYPEIQEIDVNPLSITPTGIIALDARILL